MQIQTLFCFLFGIQLHTVSISRQILLFQQVLNLFHTFSQFNLLGKNSPPENVNCITSLSPGGMMHMH
jgi:hypothetical protein